MAEKTPSLDAVIADCGGPVPVSKALGLAHQSVREWIENGHLPLSEVKGRTRYSNKLARMQQKLRLTPKQIRGIGFEL